MSITLKLQRGEEVRRLTLTRSDPSSSSFSSLLQKISALFNLPTASFGLKYLDEDGDLITLSTDLELAELLSSSSSSSVRLQVISLQEGSLPPASSSSSLSLAPSFPKEEGSASHQKEEEQPEPSKATNQVKEQEQEQEEEKEEEKKKETDEEETNGKQGAEGEEGPEEEVTLEDLLERFSALGANVQQLFEENPQIQEELQKLTQQLASLFSSPPPAPSPSSSDPSSSGPSSAGPCPAFGFPPFFSRGFPGAFHLRPQPHPHPRSPFSMPRPSSSPSPSPSPFPFPFDPSAIFGTQGAPSPFARRSCRGSSSASPHPCAPPSASAGSFPSSCGSLFEERRRIMREKLDELESMGFIDRELNLHLLARHKGDLSSVVDELERINAQFAF